MRTKSGVNRHTAAVSFRRDGEYYYRRALENRRDGRTADALKLVRKAIDSGPEDGDKLLEAAILATDLHMADMSSSMIGRAMLAGCDEAKCLYALYRNLSERGLKEEAHGAGNQLLKAFPGSPYAGRYTQDASFEPFSASGLSRRGERSMRLVSRAFERINEGDRDEGRLLMRRALSFQASARRPDEAEALIAALAADTLTEEEPLRALKLIRQALRSVSGLPARLSVVKRIQCVAAQTLWKLGCEDEAKRALDRIPLGQVRQSEYAMLIDTFRCLGMFARMDSFALSMLSERGFHRGLMHTLSVSAFAQGRDPKQVLRGWNGILDQNPEDLVIREYVRAYKAGSLKTEGLAFFLENGQDADPFAADALLERLRAVPPKELSIRWKDDEELRGAVAGMCCLPGPEHLRLAAAETLCAADAPDARRMAALMTIRPDMPPALRRAARLRADQTLAADMRAQYPAVYAACTEAAKPLRGEKMWARAMFENACRYMHDYGIFSKDDSIAGMMETVLADPWARRLCMRESDIAEAAFVWKQIKVPGAREMLKRLLKDYSITPRQLRRMADVIDRATRPANGKEAETHV